MNWLYMGSGHTSVADEPKLTTVMAAKDAAVLSTYAKTCVDNFGSHVLAAWSCKDSCEQFLKFLILAR